MNLEGAVNQALKGTNGAAHVSPRTGTGELTKIREFNTVNDTEQYDTWSESENVTSVTVTVLPGATSGLFGDGAYVVFNAPDTDTADLMLATGSGLRFPVLVGESRTFIAASGVFTDIAVKEADNNTVTSVDIIAEGS